jgi:glycosyltransferase involved in cell wall biosynthesis
MPKVTFFMPVYNRAHTIRESLDSVLAQTFKDFELLLIDDGSTDDSAAIIESYDDPRIRLLRHEQNQGIPKTRNEGLREAAGEYLALLDSDQSTKAAVQKASCCARSAPGAFTPASPSPRASRTPR